MYVESETAVLANISIAMVINRRVEWSLHLIRIMLQRIPFLHRQDNQLEG